MGKRRRDRMEKAIIEDASEDEDELCPCCNDLCWERLIAHYPKGTYWVIFCAACGKPLQERWNALP